jgi:hypothetical protein
VIVIGPGLTVGIARQLKQINTDGSKPKNETKNLPIIKSLCYEEN